MEKEEAEGRPRLGLSYCPERTSARPRARRLAVCTARGRMSHATGRRRVMPRANVYILTSRVLDEAWPGSGTRVQMNNPR